MRYFNYATRKRLRELFGPAEIIHGCDPDPEDQLNFTASIGASDIAPDHVTMDLAVRPNLRRRTQVGISTRIGEAIAKAQRA
jgi:hypothetical protein